MRKYLMSKESKEPEIGMSCTRHSGTECYCYTIVSVEKKAGKAVKIGISRDGDPCYYTLRKSGLWLKEGEKEKAWSEAFSVEIGLGINYRDPQILKE
jgi:hypothetical protein